MLNHMTDTLYADAIAQPAVAQADIRHLTPAQLRMLGLTQVAYLATSQRDDGLAQYVIRGADGIAIAAFDELDLVLEVADRLGLALVSVQ